MNLPLFLFMPVIILVFVLGIFYLTITILKTYHRQKKRRSPFTDRFLRAPGHSLLQQIDDINADWQSYFAFSIAMPFILYSAFMSVLYFQKKPVTQALVITYSIIGCIFTGYFIFKIVRIFNLRRILRLGYDGEVATGQELNQMMLHGYHVYHDFVADKFNIDHIVVGPAGVFAVETKGRAKPVSGNGAADAKVVYDGNRLQFPGWVEVKPIEQAKIQALWLERWLSSATGEKTQVRPVLALPGWFVERTSPGGIPVINPKQFKSIAKPVDGNVLDERRIKSLVHQIEQRCRNIESRAVEGLGGSMPEKS
jgi:hypothetical protein